MLSITRGCSERKKQIFMVSCKDMLISQSAPPSDTQSPLELASLEFSITLMFEN
jgi:hypothetical protein